MRSLARAGYRAVAFDQRGYSPRARPASIDSYRSHYLISDVFEVADALGWKRFDLVGHDWGAALGWMAAQGDPGRLRSLVSVSTTPPLALYEALNGDDDQRRRSKYLELLRSPNAERAFLEGQLWRFYTGLPPGLRGYYVERFSDPAALNAAINWYRAMERPRSADRIGVPTLYVWGSADAFVGAAAAHNARAYVHGPYRFEILKGVSHWVPEESPAKLSTLILEHLEAT